MPCIDIAINCGKFVSINYLNCPGFTDTPEEQTALIDFLKHHRINMIQWRNLNFDPVRYIKTMSAISPDSPSTGMKNALKRIKNTFPHIRYGYFNPPREKFKTFKDDELVKSPF